MSFRHPALGLVIALVAVITTQSPTAARPSGDPVYCIDDYVIHQFPDCVAPPTPSANYKGEPVAIGDKKRFPAFAAVTSINVLKNDAVQKRAKARVEITYRRPQQTGVRSWIKGSRIYFQSLPGRNDGILPNGFSIKYRVVDVKGRVSADTYVEMRMK